MEDPIDRSDAREARQTIGRLLDAVEAGELDASGVEVAGLVGGAVALDGLLDSSSVHETTD